MQLAREWCLSWGEWAHDADPGCAKENAAEAELRAALTTALAQQQATPKGEGCASCGDLADFLDEGGLCASCWCAQEPLDALAQQPAACPKCDGTGEADSGGIHPWGAPAMIPCDCQQPAAPALAKHQPCGCVICTCEDEQQCQGCGAKHCGNRTDHPPYVAQQPAACVSHADHMRGLADMLTPENQADTLRNAIDKQPAAVDDAKDAARYRWLRQHFRFANDSMHEVWFDALLEPNDSGVPTDLDQTIDAAMQPQAGDAVVQP